MVLKVLIITSIILQIFATVAAWSLIRKTKYNSAWILFSIAFVLLSLVRVGEYIQVTGDIDLQLPPDFFVWLGVVTSLCMAVGVLYVNKLFNYINRLDKQRRLTEKRILNTVLFTEEKERMRFAKELHDGLGPLLSSAKMSLSALPRTERGEQERKILENTAYVVEEAIRSLREISNNLSPHILNDFGLVKGVSNFINKATGLEGIKIDFTTDLRAERFDTDVEVILYRVICELINNSIKHAQCTGISLSLEKKDNALLLDYSDNGRGFNPEAVMDTGMGLANIASRIASLKGECEIRSEHMKGMNARIRVELNPQAIG